MEQNTIPITINYEGLTAHAKEFMESNYKKAELFEEFIGLLPKITLMRFLKNNGIMYRDNYSKANLTRIIREFLTTNIKDDNNTAVAEAETNNHQDQAVASVSKTKIETKPAVANPFMMMMNEAKACTEKIDIPGVASCILECLSIKSVKILKKALILNDTDLRAMVTKYGGLVHLCRTKPDLISHLSELLLDDLGEDCDMITGEEELRSMKLLPECVICYNNPDSYIALDPCGHVTCPQCSTTLATCPVCRAAIMKRLQIYLPNE